MFTFNYSSITIILLILCMATSVHAGSIGQGRAFFSDQCARCHGHDGRGGQMPGTPNFSRGEGLRMTNVQLKDRILRGKMACPSFRGILSEKDVLDVVSYLRTLH